MSEVVALLLDDAMPPERLGALLHAARKRRGLKRKDGRSRRGNDRGQAARVRARRLSRFPPSVCAQLAECYGDDLTAHVPLRVPPAVDDRELQVGAVRRTGRPRRTTTSSPATSTSCSACATAARAIPLALRTADIVALAGALGARPRRDRANGSPTSSGAAEPRRTACTASCCAAR